MKTAIGAALLSGLALIAQTTSAQAVELNVGNGLGSCPSGQLCLWADYNFHEPGSVYKAGAISTSEAIPDMGKLHKYGAVDFGMQDAASSAYNNTGSRWCLYVNNGYSGKYLWIDPGWSGQLYSPFQDSISSVRPC